VGRNGNEIGNKNGKKKKEEGMRGIERKSFGKAWKIEGVIEKGVKCELNDLC
jgi:hypothetical protein